MTTYDHIILGTGQALGTLLSKLIPTGDSIAVIEGNQVGGSCVNYGCTPTKTLVASARAIHQARRGDFFGFSSGTIDLDYARIRERMNHIRHSGRDGLTEWMESTDNVTLIKGWGVFHGPKTIQIDHRTIEGQRIYINTGTRAFIPPIEGMDQVPYLDSAGILDLEHCPQHLVILGGGYIGTEFAQIYRRFGAEVTLLQKDDQLMPREDADVAEAVREILEKEGVTIHTGSEAYRVSRTEEGVCMAIRSDQGEKDICGSHLLIAVGRRPNSSGIGLDTAGIKTDDRGYITVDDHCRTSVEGVYALGDVNGEGAFTHTSVNDAEVVLDHLFGGSRKQSDRIPVYALFTDPSLGRVGLSEKEALESGKKVLKATKPMSSISRAKEMGETQGFAKLLVDADTDMILGAAILGPGGDEVINMFAAIMHSKIPCREYRKVVLVHPTISELMPWVLDNLERIA